MQDFNLAFYCYSLLFLMTQEEQDPFKIEFSIVRRLYSGIGEVYYLLKTE